jgi:uncharacterized protein (TIRG00374 family)
LSVILVSVAAAMAAYLLFSVWGGWQNVKLGFERVGWAGFGIVLALSLVNYALRFWRWQLYLKALGHRIGAVDSLRVYVAGWALTASPGKAGEALRGLLLLRWRMPMQSSLAAFVSERLSDLTAIVLLALVGVSGSPDLQPIVLFGFACVVAGLALLTHEGILLRLNSSTRRLSGRLGGFVRHAGEMLLQARQCHRRNLLAAATALSLLGWLAEAIGLHLLLTWMGANTSLTFSVFAYSVSMLAGALSFLPGGLGGAEVVMVALLMLNGMTRGDAVAATVLIRLATLWFAVLLGLLALADWVRRHQRGEDKAV